ncbi:MAG: sulfite exporter TauE/SafE family protein [Solirubrobacterales bacterium]
MTLPLLISLLPALGLGAVLGLFGGLFGIGGGIFAIPVLVLGFGMDQATAQGTALVMMVPNLLVAWWRYVRRNPGGLKGAFGVAVVATLTTWAAASVAQGLNQGALQMVFALFLAVLGLGQLRPRPEEAPAAAPPRLPARLLPLVGIVGGSSMGLLGVGGGLVATPFLTAFFGLSQKVAQSLALALVTPSSAMALSTYASHGRLDWHVGAALGLGGIATVEAGVALAHTWSDRALRRAFALMLIVTAAVLVARRLI